MNEENDPVLEENHSTQKNTTGAWIGMVLAVIYMISPIDIIPDIPVIGWVDDFFITSTAALNLIQVNIAQTNATLANILRVLKFALIGIGIIAILLIVLLGGLIISLFTA